MIENPFIIFKYIFKKDFWKARKNFWLKNTDMSEYMHPVENEDEYNKAAGRDWLIGLFYRIYFKIKLFVLWIFRKNRDK